MFRSETETFRQRVWEVFLSKKSHINHRSIWLLVMVLSTKTPIMIAMSNPPLYFLFLVYRLEVEKTWTYSIHTTWLTFNVCLIKFYITLT
jgi:hypothetical protein